VRSTVPYPPRMVNGGPRRAEKQQQQPVCTVHVHVHHARLWRRSAQLFQQLQL
jgi:hypothetical protein